MALEKHRMALASPRRSYVNRFNATILRAYKYNKLVSVFPPIAVQHLVHNALLFHCPKSE